MNRRKLYLASPLFSLSEKDFNVKLRDRLELLVDVYLPQEDGGLLVDMVDRGMPVIEAARQVFLGDIRAIIESHYVLIVMDGRTVDEGAAFELGYASALRKTCIGLQTDVRRLLPFGNNPMLTGALVNTFQNIDALCIWLETDLHRDLIQNTTRPLQRASG